MWFDPYRAIAALEGGTLPPLERKPEGPTGLAQVARIARPPDLKRETDLSAGPKGPGADALALLDLLTHNGPSTYGAAAVALGWGATRAWQAETRLRTAGKVVIGLNGKAAPSETGEQVS